MDLDMTLYNRQHPLLKSIKKDVANKDMYFSFKLLDDVTLRKRFDLLDLPRVSPKQVSEKMGKAIPARGYQQKPDKVPTANSYLPYVDTAPNQKDMMFANVKVVDKLSVLSSKLWGGGESQPVRHSDMYLGGDGPVMNRNLHSEYSFPRLDRQCVDTGSQVDLPLLRDLSQLNTLSVLPVKNIDKGMPQPAEIFTPTLQTESNPVENEKCCLEPQATVIPDKVSDSSKNEEDATGDKVIESPIEMDTTEIRQNVSPPSAEIQVELQPKQTTHTPPAEATDTIKNISTVKQNAFNDVRRPVKHNRYDTGGKFQKGARKAAFGARKRPACRKVDRNCGHKKSLARRSASDTYKRVKALARRKWNARKCVHRKSTARKSNSDTYKPLPKRHSTRTLLSRNTISKRTGKTQIERTRSDIVNSIKRRSVECLPEISFRIGLPAVEERVHVRPISLRTDGMVEKKFPQKVPKITLQTNGMVERKAPQKVRKITLKTNGITERKIPQPVRKITLKTNGMTKNKPLKKVQKITLKTKGMNKKKLLRKVRKIALKTNGMTEKKTPQNVRKITLKTDGMTEKKSLSNVRKITLKTNDMTEEKSPQKVRKITLKTNNLAEKKTPQKVRKMTLKTDGMVEKKQNLIRKSRSKKVTSPKKYDNKVKTKSHSKKKARKTVYKKKAHLKKISKKSAASKKFIRNKSHKHSSSKKTQGNKNEESTKKERRQIQFVRQDPSWRRLTKPIKFEKSIKERSPAPILSMKTPESGGSSKLSGHSMRKLADDRNACTALNLRSLGAIRKAKAKPLVKAKVSKSSIMAVPKQCIKNRINTVKVGIPIPAARSCKPKHAKKAKSSLKRRIGANKKSVKKLSRGRKSKVLKKVANKMSPNTKFPARKLVQNTSKQAVKLVNKLQSRSAKRKSTKQRKMNGHKKAIQNDVKPKPSMLHQSMSKNKEKKEASAAKIRADRFRKILAQRRPGLTPGERSGKAAINRQTEAKPSPLVVPASQSKALVPFKRVEAAKNCPTPAVAASRRSTWTSWTRFSKFESSSFCGSSSVTVSTHYSRYERTSVDSSGRSSSSSFLFSRYKSQSPGRQVSGPDSNANKTAQRPIYLTAHA